MNKYKNLNYINSTQKHLAFKIYYDFIIWVLYQFLASHIANS